MSENALRVYVTDHNWLWQVYKILISKRDKSLFRVLTLNHMDKYTIHPTGVTHAKTKDGKVKYRKFGWPNYEKLTCVPIDGFGFNAKDFLNDDSVFEPMKVKRVKPPGVVFDISQNITAFVIRGWFGKTDYITNYQFMKDKIVEVASDIFLAAHFHRFGKIQTEFGEFDLSCAVALVLLEEL